VLFIYFVNATRVGCGSLAEHLSDKSPMSVSEGKPPMWDAALFYAMVSGPYT